MRSTGTVCLFVIGLLLSAQAQNRIVEPAPAVIGPAYEVSTGYTYLNMQMPGGKRVPLNGGDLSGSVALGPRWSATLETSYARTSNVFALPHQASVLNAQAGPEFYPFQHRGTRIFVRGLAGAALVDGAIPGGTTGFYYGWLVRPSFTGGTGFEQSISQEFGVRVTADYLRTSFYDGTDAVRSQNNFQITTSIVVHLRNRHRAGM